jgi:fucose 4-O-acetylase-like acetyltransferase
VNLDLLKGLLIILVIIDHNEFSRSLFPGFLYGMTFHVLGFMAIPFLKAPPRVFTRDYAAYVFRLYYPFMLVTVGMALVVWTQIHTLPLALYSGNAVLLKSVTQMGLLWFLPSFIAIVTLRAFSHQIGTVAQWATLAVSMLAHPLIGTYASRIQDALPMGLLPALYMYPLCVLVAFVHKRWLADMTITRALAATLAAFAMVKGVQMAMGLANEVGFAAVADYRQPLAMLVNDLEGISGTLFMFQVARISFSKLVEQVGKFSMQVYLFHAFVALGLYKLALKVAPSAGPLVLFCVTLAATVLLTLLLSKLMVGQSLTKRAVFPKGPGELLGLIGHRGR